MKVRVEKLRAPEGMPCSRAPARLAFCEGVMFCGIVETTGQVLECSATRDGQRLRVDVSGLEGSPRAGDSVALDGVCLTVVEYMAGWCAFDVVAETLRRTNLGGSWVGRRLNLERSAQVGGRVDGHIVQGHVDAMAKVQAVNPSQSDRLVWFRMPDDIEALVIPKGSIAVNGVSLTVAEVEDSCFSVALIPTTLARTNLGELRVGDTVNLETDILARTILHQLRRVLPAGRDLSGEQSWPGKVSS